MLIEVKLKIIGIGIIKVISTSKTRKIKAIKKNCIENGDREKNKGLNPHSNDEGFSRSLNDLDEIIEFRKIMKILIMKDKQKIK